MSQESQLERLKARLAGVGKAAAPEASAAASAANPAAPVAIGPEHTDFARFPEYREFTNTRWYYENEKLEWNMFRAHTGHAGSTVTIDGREMINFSSYNYLGLASDERVKDAAKRAIDQYGTSNSSSRQINGEVPLHAEFEREVADTLGVEDSVYSLGGYGANAFTIGYLARKQDVVYYDELVHNSALIGAKLSGARRFAFPHNDIQALERLLKDHRHQYERAIILTEGVFSMDGDIPDVPGLIELKQRYQALLMIDEAHSMGVIGPRGLGVIDYFGLDGKSIDIHYASTSKCFASVGGYVAGSRELVTMLKHYSPGLQLYSAAPTAPATAACLEALRIMRAEPWRARKLQANADLFRAKARAAGLDTGASAASAVVPVILGDSETALWVATKMYERNVATFPMIFPIVPRNAARLRFFINIDHTEAQIEETIAILKATREKAPRPKGLF